MQRCLRGLVQPLLAVVVLAWLCSTSQQQEQQQASGSPDANAVYLERMEVLPPPASRPWHSSLQQVMLNSHPVTAPSAPAAAAPAMMQHPSAGSTADPSSQGQGPHATLSSGPSAHPAASSNNNRSHAFTFPPPSPSGSVDPGTPFPLAPLLASWEFTLPENALRKGTGYVGSNHRLRRAVRDALNGRPLKIGAVGEWGAWLEGGEGWGCEVCNHRLRRAVRDALNGRPLKIGAVGEWGWAAGGWRGMVLRRVQPQAQAGSQGCAERPAAEDRCSW